MDHEEKSLQVEPVDPELSETSCEELTDDDLDAVAGGWDGETPPGP